MACLPAQPHVLTLDQVLQGIAEGRYKPARCYLCGGKSYFTSVCFPSAPDAKRMGEPKGKQRIAVYGICQGCIDQHGLDVARRIIEARLIRDHTLN